MISKNTAKFIKSLQIKKYRKKEGVFLVEGAKNVLEVLGSDYRLKNLFVTSTFVKAHLKALNEIFPTYNEVSEEALSSVGSFKNNNTALAIVEIPSAQEMVIEESEYVIVLDDIKDPGNLGTIIRIADWYGIKKIICSMTSADIYNPKVIAATMGSFTRVQVSYEPLHSYLTSVNMTKIGTFLEGENIHNFKFPSGGMIMIGNESRGISEEVESLIDHKISIPAFGKAESLNAGIATAIVCDNLRRNQ